MKVLFTITYYHPYVSGLTIAASRFAEGLAGEGNQVTVLTMQHDPRLAETETIRRVRIVRTPWQFKFSKGFFSFSWLIQSWRLVQTHDVIVVNLPQFEGVVPAILAKFMGKKIIVLYHCEVVLPEGFMNSVIQSLLEVSNMVTLGVSDRVVTYTSDYARSSMLLRHVRGKLTYIVPPIPKLRVNRILMGRLRKKIGAADTVIGLSARLAAEKGIEHLFAAIPKLQARIPDRQFKIVLAGPMEPVGETLYKEKIMKLVKQYARRVIFLGEISPQDMGSFYRLLDVLVLPSINRTEAFGMVQVEAMLMGVPVVASDLPGVRVPVIKIGMGIVVPPEDPGALARAITIVLTHKADYMKDVPAVQKYFSQEKSIQKFATLLI